tara:strand:- start:211 stop:438 length:228 start_codon:yes stop_codon:yes gene_type:complete
MRKTVTAAAVGLLLIAGQAAAAGSASTATSVGDRVGARADASSEFAGLPLPVLLIGGLVLIGVISVASSDDSESN